MNFKLFVEEKEQEAEIYDFKRGTDKEEATSITDVMYLSYKGKKYMLLQFYSVPDIFNKIGVYKSQEPLFIGIIVHKQKGKGWEPIIMTRDGDEYLQGASFYEGFAHRQFLNIKPDFYNVLEKALINEKGRQKLLAKFSLKPSTREHFGDIMG